MLQTSTSLSTIIGHILGREKGPTGLKPVFVTTSLRRRYVSRGERVEAPPGNARPVGEMACSLRRRARQWPYPLAVPSGSYWTT